MSRGIARAPSAACCVVPAPAQPRDTLASKQGRVINAPPSFPPTAFRNESDSARPGPNALRGERVHFKQLQVQVDKVAVRVVRSQTCLPADHKGLALDPDNGLLLVGSQETTGLEARMELPGTGSENRDPSHLFCSSNKRFAEDLPRARRAPSRHLPRFQAGAGVCRGDGLNRGDTYGKGGVLRRPDSGCKITPVVTQVSDAYRCAGGFRNQQQRVRRRKGLWVS